MQELDCRSRRDIDEPVAPFGILELSADGLPLQAACRDLESWVARGIHAQAQRFGMDAAILFYAALGLVIAHTAERSDAVFGCIPNSDSLQNEHERRRPLSAVYLVPFRLRTEGATAVGLIEQARGEAEKLLNYGRSERGLMRGDDDVLQPKPPFSTLLNYGSGAAHLLASQDRKDYPIVICVDDLREGFAITAQTDRRIDPQRIVGYVSSAVQSLVEALEQAPQTPALSLSILPESERRQVLELFNATAAPYPKELTIHKLFEQQVERTPGAAAVVYEGQSLSYGEVNAKANQLAWYLRQRSVGPDQLVGICVERSLEMVVGLLGILKAGGAYVPLDPSYPPERLQYMLEDASPRVLLTQAHLIERLPSTSAEVIALDERWDQIAQQPSDDLDAYALGVASHHLAYVIYTSGSTGKPKGAMNEHRGIVNRLQWMQDEYHLGPEDRVLQKTPFSFDVSVWEFFWTLISGARLVVARPEGHKDPSYLRQLIEETGVTTLHFVPSMLQSFLDQHRSGACASLRHIVCSGEELSPSLQRKCFECFPQVQLSNLYGPTEAAIDVTAWECSPQDQGSRVPIGHPIANIQMYVLDGHKQPVPVGVAGELYIGGVGVARGYLNRAQLTAERFIKDSFSTDPEARLYKTGDFGRWRADGNIEYLGRNDHQVKIRGFRIELGEIEAQLLRYPQVKEAVVLAREDEPGDKRLVAYLVPREPYTTGNALSVESLRAHLKQVLPDYMVPSAFVMLDCFPLSSNGKLDRRALPAPQGRSKSIAEYIAPRNELERVLVDIWTQVLRVDGIGVQNSFLDLGGHSLQAMKLIARISEVLKVDVSVVEVLQSLTIEKMVQIVTLKKSTHVEPEVHGEFEYEDGVI